MSKILRKCKDIFDCVLIGWICGGGAVSALGSLIISWEVALIIFYLWALSCIGTLVYFATR